jgi:hypothetical protein
MTDAGAPSEAIAAVPQLIERARQILAASEAHGDPETEALLADLAEAVVAASRLVLRRRIEGRSR